MNEEIFFTSEPGKGTMFQFTVKLMRGNAVKSGPVGCGK